jgi:membrane protein DedA with SNARE-associated domain
VGRLAVLLPLVVRGRWLGLDLLGAGLWALGLVAAQVALGDLLAPDVALDQARGLVAGTLMAALVAVSAAQLRPRPDAWHAPRITTA